MKLGTPSETTHVICKLHSEIAIQVIVQDVPNGNNNDDFMFGHKVMMDSGIATKTWQSAANHEMTLW